MAPPVPVYTSEDIQLQYKDQFQNLTKYKCHLKSLTQHECTFKAGTTATSPQIICLPFKRLFQRCLIPTVEQKNGKKIRTQKWINIEVTKESTNQDLLDKGSKYYDFVQEFLAAEKEFRELMEKEADYSG
ncbi:hypothetical protein CANMA_000024 [Candida margitis]|uniref:uncharacterized protein n=1 Tax=Candida margitis TaxID=1775924 RepID=UPI002227A231|nr:uncharacterized protein CANMA_000024 [Candida margitis]KAI5970864.1 hypothetical protein CANMA_000024 [Candida margitis]